MISPRRTPAIAFLMLMLPYGICSGYQTVMLGWQLAHAGVPTGVIATIQAAGIWPQTWKWAWAPLVDTTLGFKRWHVIGCVLSALTLVALACVPPHGDNLALLSLAVVVSSAASSVVSMAAEGLMAATVEDGRRGIASGWATSGNLGGVGVGGGLRFTLASISRRRGFPARSWLRPASPASPRCRWSVRSSTRRGRRYWRR